MSVQPTACVFVCHSQLRRHLGSFPSPLQVAPSAPPGMQADTRVSAAAVLLAR